MNRVTRRAIDVAQIHAQHFGAERSASGDHAEAGVSVLGHRIVAINIADPS